MSFPYHFVCGNVKHSLYLKQDLLYGNLLLVLLWVMVGLQTNKSGNQESNAAVYDHCNLTNMQVWLNHSGYPSVDMAIDFAKEQYTGVYKSFYDFASRYYGIDNLLAGSTVNPSVFKSLNPIHVFYVSND